MYDIIYFIVYYMYLFNPYIIHIFPYILFYWYIRILMLSIYFIVFIRIIEKYIDMLSIYFGILTILMIIHILSVLHIWYHIIHCIYMYLCYWYIIHIFSYFSLYWYIRILMLSIYFIVFIRIIEKYIDMLSIYFGILTIYSWLSIYYQYYIYDIIFLIWIIYYVFILLIYYPYGMLMDNPPTKRQSSGASFATFQVDWTSAQLLWQRCRRKSDRRWTLAWHAVSAVKQRGRPLVWANVNGRWEIYRLYCRWL